MDLNVGMFFEADKMPQKIVCCMQTISNRVALLYAVTGRYRQSDLIHNLFERG